MSKSDNELEVAIWYDANEQLDPITFCSESIKDMIDMVCTKKNHTHGDINYEILKPEDDRVPSVPRWLEIIDGAIPRLLVATTEVMSNIQQEPLNMVGDLDKKDLKRLRAITRREHRMAHPNTTPLTNRECDQLIDRLGLEVVLEQLGSSTVH